MGAGGFRRKAIQIYMFILYRYVLSNKHNIFPGCRYDCYMFGVFYSAKMVGIKGFEKEWARIKSRVNPRHEPIQAADLFPNPEILVVPT